ncbi:MAG: SPOR domain-containing protein, partial [Steroidobacteraceae bacterium]
FLAWAEWIDVAQPAPANDTYAKLPRLRLISEPAADVARPSSESARKTALQMPAQLSRCLSIGPFADQASATRGGSQLREKGLTPRQRAEQSEISKGFWVYIGGLKSDAEVTEVLRTLEQSHVEDAHLMPDSGDVRRVSVGLFNERERADRRAQSVQKLGLQPEVTERKLPVTRFWMDVDLPPGAASPAPATVAGEDASSPVEVIPCPAEGSRTNEPVPLPAAPDTVPLRTKVAGASKVP